MLNELAGYLRNRILEYVPSPGRSSIQKPHKQSGRRLKPILISIQQVFCILQVPTCLLGLLGPFDPWQFLIQRTLHEEVSSLP